MIKLVLLDLDGTLRDTRDIIYPALQHAIKVHSGVDVSRDELRPFIHHHSAVFRGLVPDVDEQAFYLTYGEMLEAHIDEAKAYPGAKQFLEAMKDGELELAIVTNAPEKNAGLSIETLGLKQYVSCVVGVGPGLLPKPAPDLLLKALSDLEIAASEAIFVGDTSADIEAARAASVRAIGITHGFGTLEDLEAAGADFIASSFPEVRDYIEQVSRSS